MEDYKATMTAFNPKTFHLWIREVKGIAIKAKIWDYVDPVGSKPEPEEPEFPLISDFIVEELVPRQTDQGVILASADPPIMRPARKITELSDEQRKIWKMEMNAYQLMEKQNDRIAHGIRLVDVAIKASARAYIPPENMESTVRKILQVLSSKYKRSDTEVIEQIYQQFVALKTPPTKTKLEAWITDWETLHAQIIESGIQGQFGGEAMFVKEFLKAGRAWAPNFCDHWYNQKDAAGQPLELFETTRKYRVRVDEESKPVRGHAHAATLQGAPQPDAPDQQQHQSSSSRPTGDGKHAGKECLCGEVHLFKNCPYIHTSARKTGWKENKKTRDEMRQKIQKNRNFFYIIKRITNTNILEGLDKKSEEDNKSNASGGRPPAELGAENPSFSFANTTAVVGGRKSSNPLHKSVIYDSGAANHLTFEKERFVGEIRPPTSQTLIGTPEGGMMLVHGYGTMLVKGTLNGRPRELLFENTAYVPDAEVTLISSNRLKKRGFFWDMFSDSLISKVTKEKICEIGEHFGLPTLEFTPMPSEWLVNTINPRHPEKATPWTWHLRLGHCRPQVVEKLRHIEGADVEVLRGDAHKSVECTTCAVSKMHQIINRNPTGRAIKPFQVLHFDLTINDIGFDGTRCIAHFTDEFTSFNWVYPLVNHKEDTLIPVFKSLINQCDRAGLPLNSVVSVIRTGQETSIGKRLEDWLSGQGIEWDWSAKNTLEQNGTSEKFGHLLTEKARCIGHHAKLPEDLYPECYLAAAYLLNRTPTSRLNWDSPNVAMQRATNQKITWDIARLKVFGCKAYPLLKGADAPPRSEKMKPRAFIGYLIGYDSTNIFRVWNPEKGDVSGYRDVVFDENQFYDSYEKDDLLKEAEKADFVEFRALDPKPSYTPIDSDDEDWLETPIRGRSIQPPDASGEGVRPGQGQGDEASHPQSLQSTPRGPSLQHRCNCIHLMKLRL